MSQVTNNRTATQAQVATLRTLIQQGTSGDVILTTMGITRSQFDRILLLLMREDNQFSPVSFSTSGRKTRVGSTGGISVSSQRIKELGLDTIFTPRTPIKIDKSGNTIVIIVLTPPAAPAAPASV